MARKRVAKGGGSNVRAVIGYVRVSTEAQATEGVSLDAQREAIRSYAEREGLRLATIHSDEGISGKRAANRPGLSAALREACETGAVLVVYSLSRLARNTRETLEISDRLEKADADLASLSEKIDTSGACGRMVFRLLAVLAEFERDTIAERTVAGLREKRRRGEKCGGRVPFGYVATLGANGKPALAPDAAEQAIIGRMKSMSAEGLTLRTIGATLEAEGVRPKAGASKWHPKVIAAIVKRAA